MYPAVIVDGVAVIFPIVPTCSILKLACTDGLILLRYVMFADLMLAPVLANLVKYRAMPDPAAPLTA